MNTEKVCGVYFTFTQELVSRQSVFAHSQTYPAPRTNRIEHRISSGFCSGVSCASASDRACLRAHMLTVLYFCI